jgi:outer membrane lipase/esterase
MKFVFSRSARAAMLVSAAALLAACGSADTFEPLQPTRIVSFGDSLSDLGQVGGQKWTVNGVATNIWTETVAGGYGLPLTAQAAGGASYAVGYACVAATGAAANSPCSTASVKDQISAFLTAASPAAKDLVLVQGGANDILLQAALLGAGLQTQTQMDAAVDAAAVALAGEVKRLIAAGFKQIGLANLPDIGKTIYATQQNQVTVLNAATRRFNDKVKTELVNQGANVYLFDLELFFNRIMGEVSLNRTETVCTTPLAKDCSTSTLVPGADPATYVFADNVHPTPRIHQRFGSEAFAQLKNRF